MSLTTQLAAALRLAAIGHGVIQPDGNFSNLDGLRRGPEADAIRAAITAYDDTPTEVGTLFPAGTLMLTVAIGRGGDDTDKFELSTSMSHNPIVKHEGTGQFFVLSWHDIVSLAVARGIMDPLP